MLLRARGCCRRLYEQAMRNGRSMTAATTEVDGTRDGSRDATMVPLELRCFARAAQPPGRWDSVQPDGCKTPCPSPGSAMAFGVLNSLRNEPG